MGSWNAGRLSAKDRACGWHICGAPFFVCGCFSPLPRMSNRTSKCDFPSPMGSISQQAFVLTGEYLD